MDFETEQIPMDENQMPEYGDEQADNQQ